MGREKLACDFMSENLGMKDVHNYSFEQAHGLNIESKVKPVILKFTFFKGKSCVLDTVKIKLRDDNRCCK